MSEPSDGAPPGGPAPAGGDAPLNLLGRDCFAGWSTPAPGTTAADLAPHLDDHLAWLRSLEVDGTLVLSGPLVDDPPGTGLTVVRAADAAAAQGVLERDPFVLARLRTVAVHRWRLNEGTVGITVSLATGTFAWR